jgi:hypothetical protein
MHINHSCVSAEFCCDYESKSEEMGVESNVVRAAIR